MKQLRAIIVLRNIAFVAFVSFAALTVSRGVAGASTVPLPVPKPQQGKAQNVAHKKETDIVVPVQKPSFLNQLIGSFQSGDRLSPENAARYAHVFAFQDMGNWETADAEIKKLTDDRLMGHVEYQRYMHPDYRSSFEELKTWLSKYYDHPNADRIYDLAMTRKPADEPKPRKPVFYRGIVGGYVDLDKGQRGKDYISPRKRTAEQRRRMRDLKRAINLNLASYPTRALHWLEKDETKQLFDSVEHDLLRADIASSYFFNGRPDKALIQARKAADRSGQDVPLAGWIAGLSAWKQGDYATAARYFEQPAQSKRSSAWMVSAGAYWAARAHLRNREPQKVGQWLTRAAEYPRSFYGIIALKALGLEQVKYNWSVPKLTDEHLEALNKIPQGRRALALIDAEQYTLAEDELRRINPGSNHLLQEALVALADKAKLPALSMRLGGAYTSSDGLFYDAALYPTAPWEPEDGFDVDRALVYAFIRQESKFNPEASNPSGATGLMQLMPTTASHVAGKSSRYFKGRTGNERLLDPVLNIKLGQKYLDELLGHPAVENNLFKLAVAYNAGPGKLSRWDRKVSYNEDPLLFIESIPAVETRFFVERVMTNYWIYRIRFKQDTPSLQRIAAGYWPRYVAQDSSRSGSLAEAAMRFLQ